MILEKLERYRAAKSLSERIREHIIEEVGDTELADSVAALIAAKGHGREAHISEIALLPPAPVVVLKRESVLIDGAAVQHDCDTAAKSGGKPSVSDRSAEKQSASRPPAKPPNASKSGSIEPAPEPSLFDNPGLQSEPIEHEVMTVTRRPGGGIRYIPLKR